MSSTKSLDKLRDLVNDERKRASELAERSRAQDPTARRQDSASDLSPPLVGGSVVGKELDILSRETMFSDNTSKLAEYFYGINIVGYGAGIPGNRDQYGLLLFQKPRFRLDTPNILNERKLLQLDTIEPNTMANAIRCYLDPVNHRRGNYYCDLVDPNCPFIPILGNACEVLTGFQDIRLDVFRVYRGDCA